MQSINVIVTKEYVYSSSDKVFSNIIFYEYKRCATEISDSHHRLSYALTSQVGPAGSKV